ncbi:Outer membrane protein assembly factor BamA precursor [Stieleria neptunia]|uniref:Outer membrane protein assembly factor BamA n=2 Tax=Stieleria neptunia TaxID=2527979 RepID=A0A518HY01_9BACT|nr:Outer membrane protein assembly factor BamA precursor [Stieleria neptunia]
MTARWPKHAPRMDRVFLVETVCLRLMTQRINTHGCPETEIRWCTTAGGASASVLIALLASLVMSLPAAAQMGGGMGGMGGGGGPQSGGPAGPAERPKFRDHVHNQAALPIGREHGDKVVSSVRIVGNRTLGEHEILQKMQTKKGRFFSREVLLGDVHRLNEMKSFDHVTFKTKENDAGVDVTFVVHERPLITAISFHGNNRINDRDLKGRAGLEVKDPLSEFSVESARRRLIDYYKDEGFNQVAITSTIGFKDKPGMVIFRINEGPKERIASINVIGNTLLSEARLKKLIKSRGPFLKLGYYTFNVADMAKIDRDVDILEGTYHNLGYLTANVGRRISYSEDGKWLDVTFVVNEGKRFKINSVQIIGNQFITEASLRQRLELKAGDMFDGTILKRDVGEIVYGYGEMGFIYADVQPKTVMRDEENTVDLVYQIEEGDRWKIGEIRVNIEGEPHLMRETVMLNMLEMREGDFIDRRLLEIGRRRMSNSQLLETNPQIADPPDIIVDPREDAF